MSREEWDNLFSKRDMEFLPEEYIVNNISRLKKGPVLDLACGEGRNALYLSELGFDVTAVDFSKVGIEKINRKNSDIKTSLIDLEDPQSLKELGTFDTIIINHYIPIAKTLNFLDNILNNGGIIIIVGFDKMMVDIRPDREDYVLNFYDIYPNLPFMKVLDERSFTDKRGYFNAATLIKE